MVADLAECLGFETIAFIDIRWPEVSRNGAWPVIGNMDDLERLATQYDAGIAAVGANALRLDLHRMLKELSLTSPPLIHPTATVSRHARVGSGSVVLANSVINAFAMVGEAAIINTACTIDHDCRLGDAVHVSPGANLAGQVEVGDCAWVGIGAAVRELVKIGSRTMVGAGSTVVSDIAEGMVVVGTPARPMASGRDDS